MAEFKRLGDLATYINGYPFKPEDRGTEGLPIIRIQDLTGNAYDLGFYAGDYPERIEINNGDVLISWSASLGVYIWNRGKALLNQHIFKVVFDKLDVDKQYFVYAVQHKLKEMEFKTHGATMKHIVKKDFDNTMVPFPSIEQQIEIAATLSKVKRIIEVRQDEMTAFDDLIKARFVELFGDPLINPKGFPVRTIEEVSVLNKGITYSPEDVADEGMVVLRSSNIQGNAFDLNDLVKITKKVSPDKFVQENDILMCNRNGSAKLVGKVAIIPKLNENMTFGTFMTIVRSDIHEYLFTFFQMDAFREQIKFQTAVAINQISLPLLASVKVPVPPKELIEEFAAFTEQVDKSKVAVQKALDEAQLLFDSLMQQYFG